MPKAEEKTISVPEEEKVIKIEEDEPEEDTVGHGMINLIEAKHHVQRLDGALQSMMMKLSGSEIKDIIRNTLKEFQEAMTILIPSMSDATPITVLKTIKDPTCLDLCLQMEEVESLPEEYMPDEDIPLGL